MRLTVITDLGKYGTHGNGAELMGKHLTRGDVLALLENRRAGRTARAFARDIGIAESHLSRILGGTKTPNDAVLKYLGLSKIEVYEAIRK